MPVRPCCGALNRGISNAAGNMLSAHLGPPSRGGQTAEVRNRGTAVWPGVGADSVILVVPFDTATNDHDDREL